MVRCVVRNAQVCLQAGDRTFDPSRYEAFYRPHTKDNTSCFDFDGSSYVVRVVSIYDGDTFQFVMPVHGEGVWRFSARIAGINTCEMRDVDPVARTKAIEARSRLTQLVTRRVFDTPQDATEFLQRNVCLVKVACGKMEKYGRVLVRVYTSDGTDVGETLVAEGLARRFM